MASHANPNHSLEGLWDAVDGGNTYSLKITVTMAINRTFKSIRCICTNEIIMLMIISCSKQKHNKITISDIVWLCLKTDRRSFHLDWNRVTCSCHLKILAKTRSHAKFISVVIQRSYLVTRGPGVYRWKSTFLKAENTINTYHRRLCFQF